MFVNINKKEIKLGNLWTPSTVSFLDFLRNQLYPKIYKYIVYLKKILLKLQNMLENPQKIKINLQGKYHKNICRTY